MDICVKNISKGELFAFEDELIYWLKQFEEDGYRVEIHYSTGLTYYSALLIARKEVE